MALRLYEVMADSYENANTVVKNAKGEEIARYDGRNSIPEDLNYKRVLVAWLSAKETEIFLSDEED